MRSIMDASSKAGGILARVCGPRGISPYELLGPSRARGITHARAIGAFVLKCEGLSEHQISAAMGRVYDTSANHWVNYAARRPDLLAQAADVLMRLALEESLGQMEAYRDG